MSQPKILIVDDVFDSGRSVDALIKQIKTQMRLNMPHDVRIACPWFKPKNNKTDILPDYFINESGSFKHQTYKNVYQ